MSDTLTVLVTGATGQQGGAAAQALLAKGHHVRAFTRNPSGNTATRLARAGAEVLAGDFADPATLTAAAAGADSAFLMSTPFEAGVNAERQQGMAAVDALRAAKVGHIIYASVASADENTGIPHFEAKFAIEQHLAASGLDHTIAAPVWFMENIVSPWMVAALREGTIAVALAADRPIQQVALADIGAFVADLAERRQQVFGRRIEIAGDAVTGTAMAAIVARARGRAMTYRELPLDAVRRQGEDIAAMFEWLGRVGYSVDLNGLAREFPDVRWQSFADWAGKYDWSILETAATRAA